VSESRPFEPPRVTDDDVAWVCDLFQLPKNAFCGVDGNDPRMKLLKSNETLDIEACPGSGKTTLLVAKLAILARKWTNPRCGLCVLSHTNVARREIEQRLGNTTEGKRLLSYPHFVGTIHGFVNEFLAIPWLRSLGYQIKVIANDQCEQHRRRLLRLRQFSALASYVDPREASGRLNVVSNWCVVSPSFDIRKENGQAEFNDATRPAARQLSALAAKCVKDGYYRYDEMFMWADDLLNQVPEVRAAIRVRFGVLFIDEVQDNSELQSALLFRLFMEGDDAVVRQRFGDANQAIYQHTGQTEGATTDHFPDSRIGKDIPNSHRFGQEIGNLANPLALDPQSLVGCGPCCATISSDTSRKHAILLFDDQTARNVITTYARYLLELFSEQELRVGTFTAVGTVHRPGEKDDKLPRFVGHYWPDYDPELTAAEPRPKTFRQYLMAGRKLSSDSCETYCIVEKIAEGILRLVSMSNPLADLGNRRRKHRYLLELLAENLEFRTSYLDLVTVLAVEQRDLAAGEWNTKWATVVRDIAELIGNAPVESEEAKEFLEWRVSDSRGQPARQSSQRDNIFRYPVEQPKVQIRVGSIHSVKGETHTATLVLDTFYYKHNLAVLKPWLLGQKSGRGNEGKQSLSRLKQHYVAMTRPSHLLCLGMRKDAFSDEELVQLKTSPWRVASVTDMDPVWL